MDKNIDYSIIDNSKNNIKNNNLEINNNVIFSEYIKNAPYCSSTYNLINIKSEIKNENIVPFNELINFDNYCSL